MTELRPWWGRLWYVALSCWCVLAVVASGCAPPAPARRPESGQGPGHRQQPLALSPRQEFALGIRAYNEVVDEYHDRLLPSDDPAVVRVRQITMKIAHAAQLDPLDREINLRLRGYRLEWRANVIRESKINAFCLPGGMVFVFTGILRVTQNDSQLATVLSHEVAHALAHHSSERLAREEQSGGGILAKLSQLRFSREQEAEADHIGLFLMTFAGYDPHQAIVFWERMAQMAQGQNPPEWLSDHPSDQHRIEAMRRWVPQALAGKKAYDEGRIAPPR